ncbi:hypothetical protein C9374_007367 [Naegleria lovaniensis]|uniref:GTP cyclohydrolase 1 n=1 Tax=Naegleria lovaniensis TaxID=51637 RepID=A0AA88KIT5_NAELO|nr:uncharacterized protein C9374_007367 [Naegleria lovaniensis]KAG2379228.1 hypothetical protein C9374_007367 [Naegleria lovaniensis]
MSSTPTTANSEHLQIDEACSCDHPSCKKVVSSWSHSKLKQNVNLNGSNSSSLNTTPTTPLDRNNIHTTLCINSEPSLEASNTTHSPFRVLTLQETSQMSKEEKKIIFENCVRNMLTLLGEDIEREGLQKTPSRVFHSFESLCSGYQIEDVKKVIGHAMFSSQNSQMVLIKDIEIYSLCEHHLLPFFGKCHVAYIPNGKVVGLSKIYQLVDVFAKRLQIQEELTDQIAKALESAVGALGVAVMIDARHMCVEMRGVNKYNSSTVTTSFRGIFQQNIETRNDFFKMLGK